MSLAFEAWATKQIALIEFNLVLKASAIWSRIILSCPIPLVSPNPGVSMIFIAGKFPIGFIH